MNEVRPEEKEMKSLTVQPVVTPAVTPEEAKKIWQHYQDLKRTVLEKDDIQIINGKEFLKKSYWRKIATFFNLSVEIVNERVEELKGVNGKVNNKVFHFTAKAIAPNGRYAIGTGSCDIFEKGRRNTIHNTRTTAETRAFNRAISNMLGGEVSAEEVDQINELKEEPKEEITKDDLPF